MSEILDRMGRAGLSTAAVSLGLSPLLLEAFPIAAQIETVIVVFLILLVFAMLVLGMSGVRIVQPYEQAIYTRLGNYRGLLNPGFNWVTPMISTVIRMDLRTQVLDVPRQEVITKDNSPTNVDAIIYIRVMDPSKAFFQVTDYRFASLALAQTTLRSTIGDMELDEVLYNRDAINIKLRDVLDHATDVWGVKVERVEIREVDPVGPVKAAMEEQTSAERQRRAAILRADGEKRSAILVAEGSKRSAILKAEGVKQSKILEAEGTRLATILEGQGEAQRLRILSLGSVALDSKALTVLSLEAFKKMGDGQATKIIFPFELSRLAEGISEYLGVGRQTPPRDIAKAEEIEKLVGKAEIILGEIPTSEQIREELRTLSRAGLEGDRAIEDLKRRKTAEEILREEAEEQARGG